MVKIRSVMIYLLYFYIFTLPLLSESFLSGRLGDIILLIMFLVYILGMLINRDIRGRFIYGLRNFYKDMLGFSIIILFVSMSFSVFYSYDKSIAITESLRFLSYIILYFIIKYEIIDEKSKENMLKIYISISAVLSIMGIIQYLTCIGLDKRLIYGYKFGAVRRIPVTLINPNNYGAYLILAIFPVLLLAIKEKKLSKKIIYAVIFMMLLTNVFLTNSRNAWLGFGLGCLVLIIIFSWKLVLIFGGVGVLGLFIPQIFKRLNQIFDSSQNIARIKLWKIALHMIKDHPVFGIGNGNYASLYDKYASKYPELRNGNYTSFPCHNTYLKIQAELGIIGSLSFVGILVSAWLNVKKIISNKNEFINTFYTGFLASMIAFYFMNVFDNLFFVPKTTTYFWMLLAISQSFLYNNKKTV